MFEFFEVHVDYYDPLSFICYEYDIFTPSNDLPVGLEHSCLKIRLNTLYLTLSDQFAIWKNVSVASMFMYDDCWQLLRFAFERI